MAKRTVLVGTDWWTDCDDVVAMRVLVWAEKRGMIDIAAIGINACMEHSVASLDAFLTAEGRPNVAIGIDREATDFGGNPPYQRNMLAYPHARTSNDEAEDAVRLYRRALAEAAGTVDVIEIGYPQVLAGLLRSPGDDLSPITGAELVAAKVGKLWMMAGNWEDPAGGLENNFARNARSRAAGSYVCEHWPTPITFLGWETANEILTGGTLPPSDIVAQALRDHGSANGRSSWDPMLVLLACIGDEEGAGYGRVFGTARVDAETGKNRFVAAPDGKHAYVTKARKNEYYRDAIDRILEEVHKR
ncbi:hypothetical protein [Paenibacillus sp.]|uniref:hypothetical protein n=1 Tax=Paenibacillus sp. TaxID=58172 RepID=UPI002D32330A|nr:hypothetical protein [Paenibacillus sp.]HZG55005.1 hypothetical protein [Paenibacillus sp.]